MSKESMEWLNQMTLIGFSEKRGNAWHYRFEDQGDESNHYPGAIPLDDVLRRLFCFTVDEQAIYTLVGGKPQEIEGRKAMVTSDTGDVLGIFKSGYQGHQYSEWLLDNVAEIINHDTELGIGSAGLLKNRAQAWVSVEVPESITTPEGVEFRPNLLACTSFDGSLATTYKRVVTAVVCDNTLSASLSEDGQTYKLRHTRYSDLKIQNARDALAIVYTMADDFAAEVKRLTSWNVSEKQFIKLVHNLIPLESDAGKHATTVADKKRGEIVSLWANDPRVAPWTGTAFGVLQAFNTWTHHFAGVRKGVPRVIRNMENVVTDKMAKNDAAVLDALLTITK